MRFQMFRLRAWARASRALRVATTVAALSVATLILPSVFATPGSPSGPVVKLAAFDVAWDGDVVAVTWRTHSEKSVDGFVVEASVDGQSWTAVADAWGAGDSARALDYAVVDARPDRSADYTTYRLTAQWGETKIVVGDPIVVQRPIDCRPIFTNSSYDKLAFKAQSEGFAPIIVGLMLGDGGVVAKAAGAAAVPFDLRPEIASAQQALLSSLQSAGARVEEVGRLENLPYVSMHVDAIGLRKLKTSCDVSHVEEDLVLNTHLADSTVQIRANRSWNAGHTGAGTTVAVIDTGVETTHSFLAGKVVDEMCFSVSGSDSLCPNGQAMQLGAGSGVNCTGLANCNHGTLVAGVILGQSGDRRGVAPDANLIAVQAGHREDDPALCTSSSAPCAVFATADLTASLDRLLTLRNSTQPELVAVNMSLGGGNFETFCDNTSPATTAAVEGLRAANVAVVVSSGNEMIYDGMGFPACIEAAISVGAVKADDKPADFSNRAFPDFLDFFAPGVGIETSGLGDSYQDFQGTSAAAPHMAGAWAVLSEYKPNLNVDQVEEIFKETGTPTIVFGPFPWQDDWIYVPRVNVYHRQEGRPGVDKNSLVWSPAMGLYHNNTSGRLGRAFWKHTKWNFNEVYTYNGESVESEIVVDPATSRAFAVSGGRAMGTFINDFGQIEFEELEYRTDRPLIDTGSMVWGYNMRGVWGPGSGLYAIDVEGDPILLHFVDGTTNPLNFNWQSIAVGSGVGALAPGSLISTEMSGGWGRIFAVNTAGRVVFSDSSDYVWQTPSLALVPGQGSGSPVPTIVPGSLCAIDENEMYAVNVLDELVRMRFDGGSWTTTTLRSPWAGNWGGKIHPNSLACGDSRVFGVNENNKVVTTWNETVVSLQGQDGLTIVPGSLVELQDAELYGVDNQDRMVRFVWTSGGGGWSASFVLSPWSGNWAGKVQPGSIAASPTKVYAVNERGKIVNTWNGTLVEL